MSVLYASHTSTTAVQIGGAFFSTSGTLESNLILHVSMQNSKSMVMVDSVDQWS